MAKCNSDSEKQDFELIQTMMEKDGKKVIELLHRRERAMSEEFEIKCPKCKSTECQIDSVINVHARPIINKCYQISTGTAFRLTCTNCGYAMQINNCDEFMRKWKQEESTDEKSLL